MTKRQQSFVSVWTQRFRDCHIDYAPARVVGFAMATFANADGTSVRPGSVRLMAAASIGSETTLTKATTWLWHNRWIDLVEYASRGRAAEWELILPPDLGDRLVSGAWMLRQAREIKQERDQSWTETRRDKRRGLRP